MFTGDICWENGPVAGAALDEFGKCGLKAVGLPPMPPALFALLGHCLCWNANERPDGFASIANELLAIYEDLFGESCPAQEPDLELVAADSLNNRAVSLLDIGKPKEAAALFREALAIDPEHPEAMLNLDLLQKEHALPKMPFVLSKPRSGEDIQYDTQRFNRLMAKAEISIKEGCLDDTRRYLLMACDIPGFARHPKLREIQRRAQAE
jgi:tetratricopeptide (TPR) repeat protein